MSASEQTQTETITDGLANIVITALANTVIAGLANIVIAGLDPAIARDITGIAGMRRWPGQTRP
jgi:hypothetical protein